MSHHFTAHHAENTRVDTTFGSKQFSHGNHTSNDKLKKNKEKKFVCMACNKAFASKCILKIHSYTHTGEKPFVCDLCNKTFNSESNARRHLKIHTREAPLECREELKKIDRLDEQGHKDVGEQADDGSKRRFSCGVCCRTFSTKEETIICFKSH